MKKYILGLFLLLIGYAQAQNGGACLYMLPSDSTIVCNVYGNGGVPNQSACYNEADAAGAIPMDCYAFLDCAASTYPDLGGNGCFYAGTGSCGGSGSVCDLITLPVELIEFEFEKLEDKNVVTWTTASEKDADYYTLIVYSESMEMYNFYTISAMGTTTEITKYRIVHNKPNPEINYYQLLQYDFNGKLSDYGFVSIDNTPVEVGIIGVYNMMGQEVGDDYKGMTITVYEDGRRVRRY